MILKIKPKELSLENQEFILNKQFRGDPFKWEDAVLYYSWALLTIYKN